MRWNTNKDACERKKTSNRNDSPKLRQKRREKRRFLCTITAWRVPAMSQPASAPKLSRDPWKSWDCLEIYWVHPSRTRLQKRARNRKWTRCKTITSMSKKCSSRPFLPRNKNRLRNSKARRCRKINHSANSQRKSTFLRRDLGAQTPCSWSPSPRRRLRRAANSTLTTSLSGRRRTCAGERTHKRLWACWTTPWHKIST